MAEKLGAVPGTFESLASQPVDIVVDAVGASATRQGCGRVVRVRWAYCLDRPSSSQIQPCL